MRAARGALAALVLASLANPLAASAQTSPEPGVTIDPVSPAGQEYAIPFETVRRDYGGGAGSKSGAGGATVPFGVGLRAGGRSRGSNGAVDQASRTSPPTGSATGEARSGTSVSASHPSSLAIARAAAADGGDKTLLLVAIVAAVSAALGAGLTARHLRRNRSIGGGVA
jgi:hypothetical protein